MIWALAHRRADGTFVVTLETGDLYHVTADDPIFPAVQASAEGATLPPESAAFSPENLLPHAQAIAEGDANA